MAEALPIAPIRFSSTERGLLSAGWPLWPFPFILLLWLLGLNYLIWPVVGVFVGIGLFQRADVMVPRRFGIWLLFLGWVIVSATSLVGVDRVMSYGYRFSMYFSATAILLYVYNTPRRDLPTRKIVNYLAIAWCMVVFGGLLGLVAPTISLHSPVELALPKNLLNIQLVKDMVTPAFAKEAAFTGLGIHRTQAPFPYPNAWGSNFVLLTPFALWSFTQMATRRWRKWLGLMLLVSIVPFFFSLDRGAWIALGLGLLYGATRLLVSFDVRAVRFFAIGAVVLGFLLVFTPLKDVIVQRFEHGYSDKGRIGRNLVAVDLARERPLLGYGAPQASEDNPANASVGTHGQFWLILVSNGVPALIFYLSWLIYLLVRSGSRLRSARDLRFWPHLVFLMALIMMPYYELLPLQIFTIMVAAAVLTRDALPESPGRRELAAMRLRTAA